MLGWYQRRCYCCIFHKIYMGIKIVNTHLSVIPGSCLATLFLQEIETVRTCIGTNVPQNLEWLQSPKSSEELLRDLCDSRVKYHCMVLRDLVLQAMQEVL